MGRLSASDVSAREQTVDLDDSYGGYNTADEAPAFNDPLLLADYGADSDVAYSDDIDTTDTDRRHPRRYLMITWGNLRADSLIDFPTDWTGGLCAENGVLRVVRTIRFEGRDHIVPRLGELAPRQVSRTDVVRLLGDLAKHATPTAAIDTRKWLSIMFSWAASEGRVEANPVMGVKTPLKAKPRERVLSIEEARAVWRAAKAEPYPSGTLICLLTLTAARLREIGPPDIALGDGHQSLRFRTRREAARTKRSASSPTSATVRSIASVTRSGA